MASRKKPYSLLPEIPAGSRPRVLIVGNGINLSFNGARGTDSIIKDEWKVYHYDELPDRPTEGDGDETHAFWKLPFPMQVVVASEDHVQSCTSKLAEYYQRTDIDLRQVNFIKEVVNCNFDAILTTNYRLEFERSTIEGFSKGKVYRQYRTSADQTAQQKQFGLYQCTELPFANHPLLWHIHGTSLKQNCMVMGQLFYGKLMSEVTSRANGVNAGYKDDLSFRPKSWVDYFLLGDIYIFGFDMAFSEIDIWWLLSYKKSSFPNTKVFYYSPTIAEEKTLVMNCYRIEMPEVEFDDEKQDYIDYYERIIKQVKK